MSHAGVITKYPAIIRRFVFDVNGLFVVRRPDGG